MPNKRRTINSWVYKFDFTVDEGKGRLNPSRDKNEGKHHRSKVDKSCATFLLCDPGWCVHKSDVQNRWDYYKAITHTYSRQWKLQFVPKDDIVLTPIGFPCSRFLAGPGNGFCRDLDPCWFE